jgi:hypothetical protein
MGLSEYAYLATILDRAGVTLPHDTMMQIAGDLPPGMGAVPPAVNRFLSPQFGAPPPAFNPQALQQFHPPTPPSYYPPPQFNPQMMLHPQFNPYGNPYGATPACNIQPTGCSGQPDGMQYLGFGPVNVTVAAGATAISQQPQRSFQPRYLTIPSAIAAFFSLIDLKIGNISQLNATGAIPAQNFVENATYREWKMTAAAVGNLVTMTVQNIDGNNAAHIFNASLNGEACNVLQR